MRWLFSIILCLGFVVPSGARGGTISKRFWLSTMRAGIPIELCKDGEYFRKCYQVSQGECEDLAANLTNDCVDKIQASVPKELPEKEKWSGEVGECVGIAFDNSLKHRRTEKCK